MLWLQAGNRLERKRRQEGGGVQDLVGVPKCDWLYAREGRRRGGRGRRPLVWLVRRGFLSVEGVGGAKKKALEHLSNLGFCLQICSTKAAAHRTLPRPVLGNRASRLLSCRVEDAQNAKEQEEGVCPSWFQARVGRLVCSFPGNGVR